MTEYKVDKLSKAIDGTLNSVLVADITAPYLLLSSGGKVVIVNCTQEPTVPKGVILLPHKLRIYLYVQIDATIVVAPVDKKLLEVSSSTEVTVTNRHKVVQRIPSTIIKEALCNKYVVKELEYYVTYGGDILRIAVHSSGLITADTDIILSTKTAPGYIQDNDLPQEILERWDLTNVGGLKYECNEIFRRAFISRVYGAEYTKKTGMDHVKGIILYGAPGCGKTLIARELSKLVTSVEPKLVNGPELLNKYVGASEENVRKLFADAEKEYAQRGDKSNIHIIIFDEFDSLARKRGTISNSQVYDGIVNQILSKMDGKEKLNNIIVIAMTNRLDLLDEALLCPGRFEVHIEIGLPSVEDRKEILGIHLRELVKNNSLAEVDRDLLVTQMTNFTGAEIASVVRNAVAYATASMVEIKGTKIVKSASPILVTQEHFITAIDDVVPRFGKKYFKLPTELWLNIRNVSDQLVEYLSSNEKRFKRVCIDGKSGSGKSTCVKYASQQLAKVGYDCVRYISDYDLLGLNENAKMNELRDLYEDCLKCEHAILIIDNLEIIVGYNPFLRYISNGLYQLLKSILSNNSKANKLIILITVADPNFLQQVQLSDYFDSYYSIEK